MLQTQCTAMQQLAAGSSALGAVRSPGSLQWQLRGAPFKAAKADSLCLAMGSSHLRPCTGTASCALLLPPQMGLGSGSPSFYRKQLCLVGSTPQQQTSLSSDVKQNLPFLSPVHPYLLWDKRQVNSTSDQKTFLAFQSLCFLSTLG